VGILVFCATIGGSCGTWAAGYIFDIRESYTWAFSITTDFSVIGLILITLMKTRR